MTRESIDTAGLMVVKHTIEPNPKSECVGHFPTHVVETKHEIKGGSESVERIASDLRVWALRYRSCEQYAAADLLFRYADRVEQLEETAGELLARLGIDEGDKVEIRFPTVSEDCERLAVAIDAAMPDPSIHTWDGPKPVVVRDVAVGLPSPFESFPSLNGDAWEEEASC
jgi:hypothetical protein